LEWRKREPVKPYSEFDSIIDQLASIHGIEDIHRFLSPCEDELHSPYLLKNIEAARDEIVWAIENGKNVSVHADVDSDGCTSCAIMYDYLSRFTNRIKYFHAQRSLGHSIDISENDVPEGTEILIIVDSSTNSTDACRRISEKGIRIVILDHHNQSEMNPNCVLVNPQQEGCSYPNKSISGAVVSWKMCQVLDDYFGTDYSDTYIDLVAMGLQGDLMNLMQNENRYLVSKGINNIKNVGIRAILEESKRDPNKITANDIGFLLAPNINAACRMDRIEVILDLLVETDYLQAKEKAKQVLKMNEERKKIQAEFNQKLVSQVSPEDKCSIIIDNIIGKGFKGLVAGDFSNQFQKFIMIISEDEDDTYAGSYRAYGDFDLMEFLRAIPEVIYAEGHPQAGGVRFKRSDLDKIQKYLNDNLTINAEDQFLEYILEFDIEELNEKLIKQIETFYTISGKGFETGKFLIKNIRPQKKDILGKDKNTVKITATPMSKSYFYDDDELLKMNPSATLMKFRTNAEYFDDSFIGKEIEVVGNLNLNVYTNYQKKTTKTVQVFLDDFRVIN
jgi:single-stranded-DNA-specific exonuclease